jgi:hypothetical protein
VITIWIALYVLLGGTFGYMIGARQNQPGYKRILIGIAIGPLIILTILIDQTAKIFCQYLDGDYY